MPGFERIKGFTLIELIVVISLISIMLFFAIPRFQSNVLSDSTKEVSRWILLKIPYTKERAAREQKRYILHVSLDSNRLWITHEAMSREALESAKTNGYKLPEDIKLLDVEYPDQEKISVGQADIYFNEKGYSDKAIIHLENDDDEKISFLIEPFLLRVRLYNSYAEFGD
ncbi:MAG: prepilin-type N-terminal cleavage/methylation domain-containing protein [Deltaproteobacteria bacterium]|nr:prepilin-type N-terminal cleavage/methylation domain-containing protein [Deltaproteobacteria bacterium]